ncbi:hypothetical protein SK069_09715 [Patulibacter brassicae]|uniref:Phage tail protein n=1 Tax=Patulibacter brassicae TaxID=1705717 RepID=A0ABU4VJ52_9ACTN|nr:hypothetical protein [Patulibacter brassicae]MDX8151869.1 hypothetical protein [Patulibacter brassicae]
MARRSQTAQIIVQIRGALKAARETRQVARAMDDLGDEIAQTTRAALISKAVLGGLAITTLPMLGAAMGATSLAAVALLGGIVGLGAGIGLMAAGAVMRFKETADQAGSAANAVKQAATGIRDAFGGATAKGADLLLGGLARGLERITPLVSEFTSEFTAIGAASGRAIERFFGRIQQLGPEIGQMLRQVPDAIGPLGQLLGDLLAMFVRLANVGMPLVIDGLQWLSGAVRDFTRSLTAGRVQSALDLLGAGFRVIGDLVSGISQQLGPVLGPATKRLAGTLSRVARPLGQIAGSILSGLVQIADGALPGIEKAIKAIAPLFNELADSGVLRTLGQVFGTVVGYVVSQIPKLVDALRPIQPFITNVVVPAVKFLWAAFQTALPIVIGAIGVLAQALGWLGTQAPAVAEFFAAAWGRISSVASTVGGAIATAVRAVVSVIRSIVSAVRTAAGGVRSAFDGIVSFVSGLPGRIAKAASGMWDGLKAGLDAVVEWIRRRINDLTSAISSIPLMPDIPTIQAPAGDGGPFLGAAADAVAGATKKPKRRKRATGGMVAYGETTLVGERGPELVQLPTGSKVTPAHETARQLGAQAITRVIQIVMPDGRVLAEAVDRENLRDLATA